MKGITGNGSVVQSVLTQLDAASGLESLHRGIRKSFERGASVWPCGVCGTCGGVQAADRLAEFPDLSAMR